MVLLELYKRGLLADSSRLYWFSVNFLQRVWSLLYHQNSPWKQELLKERTNVTTKKKHGQHDLLLSVSTSKKGAFYQGTPEILPISLQISKSVVTFCIHCKYNFGKEGCWCDKNCFQPTLLRISGITHLRIRWVNSKVFYGFFSELWHQLWHHVGNPKGLLTIESSTFSAKKLPVYSPFIEYDFLSGPQGVLTMFLSIVKLFMWQLPMWLLKAGVFEEKGCFSDYKKSVALFRFQ